MDSVFYLRSGNAIYLSVYYLMLTKRSYCDLNLGNGYDEANNSPPDISVLNVAENEETAKNIANFLSDGNARIRNGIPHYNKIYEFQHNLEGEKRNMIMTSVSGHILNFDFTGMYKSWTSCSPASLFEAPLLKTYPMDYEHAYIKHTLETEIQSCDTLIIWTDCDNEGENIGFEIASVCTAINPNITIHRARFSEITAKSVQHAMDNLEKLNKHISDAVDVRSEIDLRIGAAFTRFQTLRLRQVFPNLLRDNVLSYGTLQFPTLGLVVDRYLDIKNFSPEPFWTIKVTHGDNDSVVNFTWKRGQVFNDETCRILYRHCRKVGEATVESIKSKLVHKKGPQPLDTLELQKSASEKLKLTAKTVMDAAEKLYSEGFISFPRSEGSVFPEDIDLQKLVQMQIQDRRWGKFASHLLKKVLYPREGDKHDQFHPPVHPVKYADSLTGIEAVVYEFIVRHFLACVSDDAVGNETVVNIDMDGEKFYAHNLSIVERNYLDVYPYDEWPTSELTRSYKEGQRFVPTTLETVSGETLPFKRLTEAELIQNMQEFGIGTIDATYAETIDKIKSRLYISLQNGTYFIPGPIGMGLVEGYNSMGVHLAEPHQRAELEADLRRISKGVKDPKTVLVGQLEEYKKQYRIAQRQASKLDTALSHYLPHKPVPFHEEKKASTYSPVMKCPKCGSDIVLKLRPNNTGYYLSCLGFPNCKTSMWFPSNIIKMKVQSTSCSICGPRVKKLKFEFEPGSMHPFYPDTYVGCVNGCDLKLLELLHLRPISTIVQTTPKIEGSGQQSLKSARDVEEDTISQGDQILCGCGLPAVLRTVRKEGRNKGRQFYSCPKPMGQQCNFLEWADKIPADGGSSSRGTNYQPQSLPATDEGIRCKCGLPAIKLTVKKEGRNKGNIFYKCPKPRHQQCDFIEWADNKYAGGGSRTNYQYSAKSKFTARTATDSRGESNRQQNDDEPDAVLCCDCGLPAKKSVVKKLGGNKGREFYGCPNPRNKQCKYFQWADQLPSGTGTNYQPRYSTKSSFSERKATDTGSESSRRQESGSASNNQNNDEPDNTICCNCGLPAKKAVVMRQTQNKGREFYVCPKPKAQQCGFYQWADEVPSGTGPRGTNYQSRYKTKSSFYDRKGSGARSDTQRKSSSWSSSRSSQNVESSDDKELCHCGLPAKIYRTSRIIRNFSKGLNQISRDQSTMKVLNVAEKNDVAKNVAFFLSGGNSRTRNGLSKYNKIYEFQCAVQGQMRQMMMTSVSGHLLNFGFSGNYKYWKCVSPSALFDAPVVKQCLKDYEPVKQTLEKEIRSCDTLIIWTDCDREGENIGFEIASVCRAIKPNIRVYRAKFSEITARSVNQAINNLGELDKKISDAVDVRSELDLRIGAAFTRFQTLRLQQVFPNVLQDNIISYGSCQFPTLGFVVERYKAIENFIPETFWKIQVVHTLNDVSVNYNWERGRLFDKQCCQALFDRCEERPLAKVEKVTGKPKTKWRPQPLDTVELQKTAARKLKLTGKTTLAVAEKLYTQGFISYPRTETNVFSKNINLMNLVEMQTGDNRWGGFANRVLQNGPNPRNGKKNDQAHPPIHPIKYTNSLTGTEATVYEFIVRHFLACVSLDAVGHETTVKVDINGEKFNASGLNITERNYLDVYPYDSWSSKQIHRYQEGQTFHPTVLEMTEGETSPPKLLTEAELIALMDKHGIGTDATHAEHIDKIKSRLYVGLENGIYFVPGHLGIGLVDGYDSMGFQMSKPHLRAELEADLKRICNGEKDPKIVLAQQIEKYREVFRVAQQQANKLDTALSKYLSQTPVPVQDETGDDNGGFTHNTYNPVMKCPQCRSDVVVKTRPNNGGYYLSCMGYPQCKVSMWFPGNVLEVQTHNETCINCGPDVKMVKFKFRPDSMKPYYPNTYIGCVNGCDNDLLELMNVRPLTATRGGIQPSDSGNDCDLSRHPAQGPSNFHLLRTNSDVSSTDSRRQPTQQAQWPIRNDSTGDGEVCCNCGLPAKKLTVVKESVNKGRMFYTCSKPQDQRCNFFQWADDGPPSTGNAERRPQFRGRPFDRGSPSPNRRGGSRKRTASNQGGPSAPRRCGLCGEPGHTRRNCPQA